VAKSINTAKKVQEYLSMDTSGFRKEISDDEFKIILGRFYKELESSGFFVSKEEAKKNKKYCIMNFQHTIIYWFLYGVFMQKRVWIYVTCARQLGKTQILSALCEFVNRYYFTFFGGAHNLAIVAPEKGTASELYNRIKTYIMSQSDAGELDTNSSDEVKTVRGDSVRCYSIYKSQMQGASTREGRTHQTIVRDESASGSDEIFLDEVVPTTNRTLGPIVMLGNGGYGDCLFRRRIENAKDIGARDVMVDEQVLVLGGWDEVIEEIDELIEAGITSAATWKENTLSYVKTVGGWNSVYARKNVKCMWEFSDEEYVSQKDLDKCESMRLEDMSTSFALGFDISYKGSDRSIATLVDNNKNVIAMKVIRDAGEGAVSIESQCGRMSKWIATFPSNIRERIVALGIDSTGVGFAAKEIIEKLLPYAIRKHEFTAHNKMDWYISLRDAITADVVASRIRFNRDGLLGFDPGFVEECFNELISLTVTVSRSGLLLFGAPTTGRIMGKALNDDYVASLAIALNTIGEESGFFNYVLNKKSELKSNQAWDEDRPISSAGPPRISKFRRLAKKGCDPFQDGASSA